MAFVRKVEPEEAEGPLARLYEEASRRAGKVYEILKLQSLRPDVLRAWTAYYQAVMFGDSKLTRIEREMVATVVSLTNACHY